MPIFHQKNQPFKTTDILVMFGLVGVVATLSGAVLARSLQGDQPGRARSSAEALALQLAERMAATKPGLSGGRAPASVGESSALPIPNEGEIGKDPWGQPFHYLILQGPGPSKKTLVWSYGPNHQSDSLESIRKNSPNLSYEKRNPTSKLLSLFSGDDIGFVHED